MRILRIVLIRHYIIVILFQLRIQFDDKAVSTHEYQSETSALAQYLEENPHEKGVVEKEQADFEQMSISLDLENSESSDDVVETPRDTVAMKSNTAIGAGKSVDRMLIMRGKSIIPI